MIVIETPSQVQGCDTAHAETLARRSGCQKNMLARKIILQILSAFYVFTQHNRNVEVREKFIGLFLKVSPFVFPLLNSLNSRNGWGEGQYH